jgi:hypothetical protein
MQQTSPDTPGNTKDGLRSRNTRISCSSLTTKHAWYIPHSNNLKPHLKPVAQNVIMRNSQNDTKSQLIHIMPTTAHSDLKYFRNQLKTKNQKLHFSGVNAQWQNGLVERSNGILCAAARSMLNHTISRCDKTITAELWPFAIQHATTIYNTTKRISRDYNLSPWEQFTGERSKLSQTDMHPLFCPVYVLDR